MSGCRDRVRVGTGVWCSPLWVAMLCAMAACIQDSARPGPLGGPSELGLSVSLAATPDMLPLDGEAQALLAILARDQDGVAISNLTLSLQIATARGFEDFGRLSARQVVTGSDGRARATYTAPSTIPGPSVDTGEMVTIVATPVDSDYASAVSRELTIRLIPRGVIIPPFSATPGFTFTPATPTLFNAVLFTTACTTATSIDCVRDPAGIVTSYRWDLGDGGSRAGPTASHRYGVAGTHLVTLTIRDGTGRFAEVTRSVVVGGGTPPTAELTVSPTDPKARSRVFFSARGSTAAAGRAIVSRSWDFGDGSTASGVTASHAYDTAGAYTVTLTVTDDKGQAGTVTASVVVGAAGPTASFVFSPTDPSVGSTVFFDGHGSDPGPGRTMVTYRWNLGDGVVVSPGPDVDHTYSTAGTYDVQLTVTNNVGEVDTTSKTVTVAP